MSHATPVAPELAELVSAFEQEDGRLKAHPDGSWSIAIECSMAPLYRLMASTQTAFEAVVFDEVELVDGYGQAIDVECASGVLMNQAQRAVLVWQDHWQAGLFATLTVYADEQSFARSLSLQAA